ncbi:fumarylacetoacetate hydrolase family protein [Frondihabitans australicus]|uniref:Fumarylpyruvate hydrolase n=1 Tax=Frondihabitans australicus TaxID=386892 RepID=A0A495ILS0_9MICO|nr:fumarylacetoacetate hydrolase family protein [Frondihabitans australicus]RKR76680.1 fumarylpyruvate hydrolase [Frondihabitans australicus]
MSDYVVTPPEVPSVAVAGSSARFPVRRILCVGRNYADHAREMGSDPDREPPFFFAKPGDAVVPASGTVPYPTVTAQLEYEVELVVAIGVGGASITPESALDHVWGYGVGVDLTRRDRQQEAKDTRRPWDLSKGFDASAPVAPLVPAGAVSGGADAGRVPAAGRVWLAVNGAVKQDGDLDQMIWPVADVIAAASRAWELAPGDLIFTGTPSGVGPIVPGDTVTGGIDGLGEFSFVVGEAPAA